MSASTHFAYLLEYTHNESKVTDMKDGQRKPDVPKVPAANLKLLLTGGAFPRLARCSLEDEHHQHASLLDTQPGQ
jgi:hypothetical protein